MKHLLQQAERVDERVWCSEIARQFLTRFADPNNESFLLFISVVPAVLGLTLAAILAVAACFCARRVRRQGKKSNPEAAFPFQAPPRPTRAVRSPNGITSHYLKKSPSPTSIKPLPGVQSPTTDPLPPQTTTTKYSAESEISKSIIGSNELGSPVQDQVDNGEYGKLGTLVFKLRFLVDRNALVVSVVRCRGLPSRNMSGSLTSADSTNIGQLQTNGKTHTATATDPYVKLQLLPDKAHKVKTRWVEILSWRKLFHSQEELQLSVACDHKMWQRHEFYHSL